MNGRSLPADGRAGSVTDISHPAPPWWLIAVPAGLVWCYLAAQAVGGRDLLNLANAGGPLLLGVSAAVAAYRLVRRSPESLWTPYAWFLLAIVLFYCVGPLIYPLAGPHTLAYAQSFLPVSPKELLRTNLLDAVGVLGVLLGVRLVHSASATNRGRGSEARDSDGPPAIAVAAAFLAAGGVVEYLLVLPADFGLYRFVLPGVARNLGDLYLLGLMVLSYVVARGARRWRLPLVLLWTIQLVVSLLLFSKHQLILTLFLPPLGAFLGHRRKTRLLLWAAVAAVVYFSVAQLVLRGRQQVFNRTGSINRAGLVQRVNIVERWINQGMPRLNRRVSSAGTGWNRLNYAPVQAFAMRRYDKGYPGHTLRYAPIIFIPRFLWPNKPVVTQMSVEFYQLITGRRGTHEGLGIFGEGYWDYGWAGVLVLGFVTGMIYGLLGGMTIRWMKQRLFLYVPAVFLGVNMGIVGTTGFFVNYILGPAGFFFVYCAGAFFVTSLATSFRRRRVRPRHPRTSGAA